MNLIKDGKKILELTETKVMVLKHDLPAASLENDLARRAKYWVESPVEKLAAKQYSTVARQLKEKNEQAIPTCKKKALFRHTELYPSSLGFDDINSMQCSMGKVSFEISANCRKVWRKLLENKFKEKDVAKAKVLEDCFFEERIKWIITHKYERCLERLKNTWLPLLEARGITSIPLNDEELCQLIFSQPDYKDREARDREEAKSITGH